MYCKQTFALIAGGTIQNDIVCSSYTTANELAKGQYGVEAFAVDSTQYPVSIGDYYRDGIFYFKDGNTPVPRQNTAEEDARLALLNTERLQADMDYVSMETGIAL